MGLMTIDKGDADSVKRLVSDLRLDVRQQQAAG
jgi:hypothetical protein